MTIVPGPSGRSDFDLSPRVRADAIGFLTPMVTQAQNFEDVILRRVLQDIEHGFYVDVGAWHPIQDSVTAWFYRIGWRGINVEPNPEYFIELEKSRPRDMNLACVIGATNGSSLFTIVEGTGLSSGDPDSLEASGYGGPARRKVVAIPQVTLDHLLSLAGNTIVDFLKIDVEGMEGELLGAAEFERHRPRILVVEATRPGSQLPTHNAWEADLLAKGYEFALFDGLNRFYVRQEDAWRKAIFASPPCVFDNFLAPTLTAHRQEAEAAAARSEEERVAAVEQTAILRNALGDAEAQIAIGGAALLNAEAERRANLEKVAILQDSLGEARAQIESTGAELSEAKAERQAGLRRLDGANAQISRLEETLERSQAKRIADERRWIDKLQRASGEALKLGAELSRTRAEAAAWEEARTWAPPGVPTNALLRIRPLRALHRRWLLSQARRAAKQSRWSAAADHFGQALAARSNTPLIWVEYGHALKEAGDLSAASRAYRKVLLLMPDHHDIGCHLTSLLRIIEEKSTTIESTFPAVQAPSLAKVESSTKSPVRPRRPWQTHRNPRQGASGFALAATDPSVQRTLLLRDIGLARPDRRG